MNIFYLLYQKGKENAIFFTELTVLVKNLSLLLYHQVINWQQPIAKLEEENHEFVQVSLA